MGSCWERLPRQAEAASCRSCSGRVLLVLMPPPAPAMCVRGTLAPHQPLTSSPGSVILPPLDRCFVILLPLDSAHCLVLALPLPFACSARDQARNPGGLPFDPDDNRVFVDLPEGMEWNRRRLFLCSDRLRMWGNSVELGALIRYARVGALAGSLDPRENLFAQQGGGTAGDSDKRLTVVATGTATRCVWGNSVVR